MREEDVLKRRATWRPCMRGRVLIESSLDRKAMSLYELMIESWRTMTFNFNVCACMCVCSRFGLCIWMSTEDDTPHCCHSKTTCNTHSPSYWNTLTHTYTHSLKWRVWNWAGTWNKYSKQLSLSPALVIHFPWIYSHLPLFFSCSSRPPSILLFCYTFSPPSFLLPHRWWCLSLEPSDKMWQYSNHTSDLWQQMPVTCPHCAYCWLCSFSFFYSGNCNIWWRGNILKSRF